MIENSDDTNLRESLQRWFGHDEFRDGQERVISCLMNGRSAAAIFPTGSGKSLCYQLPSVLLPGLTIVVSPLIALMKDQIDQLKQRDIAALRLDSTLSPEEMRNANRAIREGSVKLLYVAPERFNNERFRQLINECSVSLFAVDEAHCISEWGHNFRPDYLKLARYARLCKADRVLALTATAPTGVVEDICRELDISFDDVVRTGFFRPNLHLEFCTTDGEQRDELLVDRILGREPGPTIVYVTRQKTAVDVADLLEQHGLPARAYHAGFSAEVRSEVQDWFIHEPNGVIVATIAFGMGIDKNNIRYIYHYNLPKSLENYAQEIGRAGRDGGVSVCETLAASEDLLTLENFARAGTPSLSSVNGLLRIVFEQNDAISLSLYHVARDLDISSLVARTLLTYLELEDYIEGGTPIYNQFRFKLLRDVNAILSDFEGERREFLETVFREAKSGRTWLSIDADSVATRIDSPRDRIVKALDFLHDQGGIELQASGVQHRYQILKRPSDLDVQGAELHQRMVGHEKNELKRLQQVCELIESNTCQQNRLCSHFGEERAEPCGHCAVCTSVSVKLHEPVPVPIDPDVWERLLNVRSQHAALRSDAVAFARFVCGVRSPALVTNKLVRHNDFGVLGNVRFEQIEAKISELESDD